MANKYSLLFDDKIIHVIESDRRTLSLQVTIDGVITVRAPRRIRERDIISFLEQKKYWLRNTLNSQKAKKEELSKVNKLTQQELDELFEKALQIIPERVKHYAPIIGVDYGRITIRNQRTRWGSCSSLGNLNFNCLLLLAPPEVLDSVVVHELCHRKVMNHSPKFYELVLKAFPNYYSCDIWLKKNGGNLLKMMP